jgi:hypothetical protein
MPEKECCCTPLLERLIKRVISDEDKQALRAGLGWITLHGHPASAGD